LTKPVRNCFDDSAREEETSSGKLKGLDSGQTITATLYAKLYLPHYMPNYNCHTICQTIAATLYAKL
jgi:hypothetical protein